jgi:hypothetical protein
MALTTKIVSVNMSARQLNVIPLEKFKEKSDKHKKTKHKNRQKKRRR